MKLVYGAEDFDDEGMCHGFHRKLPPSTSAHPRRVCSDPFTRSRRPRTFAGIFGCQCTPFGAGTPGPYIIGEVVPAKCLGVFRPLSGSRGLFVACVNNPRVKSVTHLAFWSPSRRCPSLGQSQCVTDCKSCRCAHLIVSFHKKERFFLVPWPLLPFDMTAFVISLIIVHRNVQSHARDVHLCSMRRSCWTALVGHNDKRMLLAPLSVLAVSCICSSPQWLK